MKNQIIEQVMPDGSIVEVINVFNGNDCVSMLKTEYDRRQAEQSTPIVTADE